MSARIPTAIPSSRGTSATDSAADEKTSPKAAGAFFNQHCISQATSTSRDLEPHEVVARHMDSVKSLISSVERLPMEDSDKENLRSSLHQSFKELSMMRQIQANVRNPEMVIAMADDVAKKAEELATNAHKEAEPLLRLSQQFKNAQLQPQILASDTASND